ncbi:MAG: hypothetical protein HC836_30280 [Richelia sp. RM2_1_2]|nr:hypothetical protein [Richelia sp. RM2_1_2]
MLEYLTTEFDIIFLSYDEPNAEDNWADLLRKAPWAKRVHGVRGFDSAHKACALRSDSERFITVDGDNIVDAAFFNQRIKIVDEKTQISWSGKNSLNGLIYGNGGLKLWTRDFVLSMRTHESADNERAQTDFCWEENYIHESKVWSETHITKTPFQAFKAGFREGVKMSLLNGVSVEPTEFLTMIPKSNLRRLIIWCSVGAHKQNGLWATYGARLGCYMANIDTNWDKSLIRDYDWFNDFWNNDFKDLKIEDVNMRSTTLKKDLEYYLGLKVANLDSESSQFFMETNQG